MLKVIFKLEVILVAALGSIATTARADGLAPSAFELHVGGYGEMSLAFHDHGADQNREGGSLDDARLELDTTRFVVKLEGVMPHGIEFESEIELEHGGTGAAMEIEYEEFGEFEQELEKGGEVLVEELYLKRSFGRYTLAFGRFYVGVGLLSSHNRPTDYLATTRAESETRVVPAVWDEMGVSFTARFGWGRVLAQLVNGLDSTGFSSQYWVSSGHQARFETVRGTDPAGVLRVDVTPSYGVEVGASIYAGGTTRNRPKADLVRDCDDGDQDAVAPCGYVGAPLVIADVHASWRWRNLRGSALALWGHLGNADAISERNERLSNDAGVLRSPVADEALALWAEVGVDVAPWLGLCADNVIEPFARLDHYDTMVRVRDGLFDNPRFERTVITAGAAYTYRKAITLKLDASHRRFGTGELNDENTIRFATGFVY